MGVELSFCTLFSRFQLNLLYSSFNKTRNLFLKTLYCTQVSRMVRYRLRCGRGGGQRLSQCVSAAAPAAASRCGRCWRLWLRRRWRRAEAAAARQERVDSAEEVAHQWQMAGARHVDSELYGGHCGRRVLRARRRRRRTRNRVRHSFGSVRFGAIR